MKKIKKLLDNHLYVLQRGIMVKRLSPSATIALKDALCSIYWYKADLRSFIQNCLNSTILLASLNWNNYKRQIVSDLIDHLSKNQDQFLGDLTRLCYEVCNMSSFDHLKQLEGGDQKAERAKIAVNQLKELVEPHQEIIKEHDKIAERQKFNAERLRANSAVQEKLEDLKKRYMTLIMECTPQERGFELEKIMYDLFELFDLDPKASFRNSGEQIDGAFAFEGTEFLFEAKWKSQKIGAADLDTFASKIKRKLENTLGVFLSINGFTEEGISAHSTGQLVTILIDGADLMSVFEGRIDFVSLLMRKKRHACQTGNIYLPIHEILNC